MPPYGTIPSNEEPNLKNLALLNTNNQDGSFLARKLLSSLTRKTLVFLSW